MNLFKLFKKRDDLEILINKLPIRIGDTYLRIKPVTCRKKWNIRYIRKVKHYQDKSSIKRQIKKGKIMNYRVVLEVNHPNLKRCVEIMLDKINKQII